MSIYSLIFRETDLFVWVQCSLINLYFGWFLSFWLVNREECLIKFDYILYYGRMWIFSLEGFFQEDKWCLKLLMQTEKSLKLNLENFAFDLKVDWVLLYTNNLFNVSFILITSLIINNNYTNKPIFLFIFFCLILSHPTLRATCWLHWK